MNIYTLNETLNVAQWNDPNIDWDEVPDDAMRVGQLSGKANPNWGNKMSDRHKKIISNTHKGKKKSIETRRKLSRTIIEKGLAKEKNNGNAKQWVLVSPDGKEHFIEGRFVDFCNKNNLLYDSLRYYRGKPVPPVNSVKNGGFRAKSKESEIKRYNTVGWQLKL